MKNLLAILLLFSFVAINAQKEEKKETKEERRQRYINEGNPFKKYGYTPRIATLSKGKYREFFVDTIIQIGSFEYNRVSKEIIGFTLYNKENLSEADLQPELVSRWMSPDPLSDEFPSWSPYTFVYNNPVRFIDPTGLAPEDLIIKGKKKAKDGYVALLNNGLGGNFASYDKNGKVSLNVNRDDLKTDEQKSFFDVISNVTDDTSDKDTVLRVRSGDGAVTAGSFTSGIIDVQDIDNFGSKDPLMNKTTVVAHETDEQYRKQVKGETNGVKCCQNATGAEKSINGGWQRGTSVITGRKDKKVSSRGRTYTAKSYNAKVPFTKNGVTRYSTYRVVNGNVIKKE